MRCGACAGCVRLPDGRASLGHDGEIQVGDGRAAALLHVREVEEEGEDAWAADRLAE